ncbi:MAG: NADH-quinone oxidoreductase subunit NuoG, partial [Acinetobacter bohemicus]
MATIHVDGKSYEVNGSENLLQACLSLGIDIPYFCWHPSLGSVGSCRQCAVTQYANADDTRGRLVMSCMTPASDNTYISIEDKEAKDFRASIVEFLMTNHPHDCPVCEEGGHCHLQDMTVMTQHDRRRYRFTKRTHYNQELGSFISHEMNRCIACYRCVRYYKDYAGGTDFGVYASASRVYFGRPESGTLESEFSGNLTEVCPTGVFTDKTHSERYNRKWDMQYAPSVCQGCSSGCNISPGERYGELRRVENRFNGDVNQYFLCDKGRFGTGYVNRADRPRQPQFRSGENVTTVSVDQALDTVIESIQGKKVLGIGSPRASLESNFALRELVGQDNFSTGLAQKEQ